MLIIRLQRTGRTNSPEFRLVLMEKLSSPKSSAKEIFGSFNPRTKKLTVSAPERLQYWAVEQHIPMSPTVNNLLVTNGLISGAKVKSFTLPPKKEAPAAPEKTETVATEDAAVSTEAVETAEVATEEKPTETEAAE